MTPRPRLIGVPPPRGGVYRLARRPENPFAPPDWAYAAEDGTFGNRFHDRMVHAPGQPGPPESLFPDDPDLVEVARLFDLAIEGIGGHLIRP